MMRERIVPFIGPAGIGLVALGVVLQGVRFPHRATTLTVIIAGLVALAVFAFMNRSDIFSSARQRRLRHGTNSLLMTLFFTAILVLIQAISLRNIKQFDITRNQRFTLAPQTTQLLEKLDQEITLTAFFRRTESKRDRIEDLLKLYVHQSDQMRYEIIDPDRKPFIAEQLGADYGDVVVANGERQRVVGDPSEETITNAILQVTLNQYKSVYFTTGHNEKDIHSHEREGYASMRRGLENEGYRPRELSLTAVDEVPGDCQVIIVGGPRKQFLPSEVDKLRYYLDHGGSALFLIDPRVELPNLGKLLATYSVVLDPVVLLDEVELGAGERVFDATVTKIRRYEDHPITHGFNAMTMYPMCRTVRLVPDSTNVELTAQYLAATDKTAWGETDMNSFTIGTATKDPEDYISPLPMAAVINKIPPLGVDQEKTGLRASDIIVFGDSDWVNNVFYDLLGNSDLFLNCVNFLAKDENQISLRPKARLGDRVYITESQGRMVFAICIVLLPFSVAALGGYVFARNRQA